MFFYDFLRGAIYPVHCRMFTNIPGLHPLDVSSNPLVVTSKTVYGHCQMSSGGQILPTEKHCPREMLYLCRLGQCPGAHQWTQPRSAGPGQRSQSPRARHSPWDIAKIPLLADEEEGFYSWGLDKVLFQKPYSASFILSVPSFIFKLPEERVYPF